MKKAWLCLSLVAVGSAAFGQEGEPPPPSPVVPQTPVPLNTVDENFINIESGKPIIQAGTISIGGDRGITYSRTLDSSINNVTGYGSVWFDNLSGVINSDLGDFSIDEWGNMYQYGAQYTVSVDGTSERFLNIGYDYPGGDSPFAMGSEGGFLSFNGIDYTYKSKNGNIYYFSRNYSDDYVPNNLPSSSSSDWSLQFLGVQGANRARVTRIERSDGTIIRYHYRREWANRPFSRLQSIVYSNGYQIKFEYESNQSPYVVNGQIFGLFEFVNLKYVRAINNAFEYCDPSADTCTLFDDWRKIEYTGSYAGSRTWASSHSYYVKDTLGNSTRIDMNRYEMPVSIWNPGDQIPYISYNYYSTPNPNSFSYLIGGLATPVQTVNKGDRSWSYGYQEGCSKQCIDISITHPDNSVWTYRSKRIISNPNASAGRPFVASGMIERAVDGLGRTTIYNWSDAYYDGFYRNPYYVLRSIIYPGQRYSSYTYDSSKNLVKIDEIPSPGSSLSPLTASNVFNFSGQSVANPCSLSTILCGKLSSTSDFKGNATSYTYDSVHGGILTEARAPVNGVQPVRRFSYAQRYAWTKNASGSYSPSERPIWVIAEERTCRTTATTSNSCVGGATDEIVIQYDYGPNSGPNNLQIKGIVVSADGVTSRTCFGYDRYGNKIWETKPKAELASCY